VKLPEGLPHRQKWAAVQATGGYTTWGAGPLLKWQKKQKNSKNRGSIPNYAGDLPRYTKCLTIYNPNSTPWYPIVLMFVASIFIHHHKIH